MAAPLRGTQSLVGQMGWVFDRPSLTLLEVAWRWIFGIPFLAVCWKLVQQVLAVLSPEAAGLTGLDPQNPWVAAVQLDHAWSLYQPPAVAAMRWLFPVAGLAWIAVSSVGRSLVFKRLSPQLPFRPLALIPLQAAWLALFGATCFGWFRSIQWVAAAHIATVAEPDLVGYSIWAIFLSLGFYTLWALISWPFSIAPLLVLAEDCTPAQALARSLRLGKPFTGKLVEINLVMGIVKLALVVLAMVFSAAPLPFSDELGGDALRFVWLAAVVFYLVAGDYFQIVRLKGFIEFWRMFRGASRMA